MSKGVVKIFFPDKGYGFITCDDEIDVFVHFSNIISEERDYKNLYKGERVEFDIIEEEKGLVAKNVKIIEMINENEYYNNLSRDYKKKGYERISFYTHKLDANERKKEKLRDISPKKYKSKSLDEWMK